MTTQTATFAAGCFWGVEARFRMREGVLDAASGYMGGNVNEPGYREVCSGNTGHAEVVQVQFDDGEVTYGELVELFFSMHDPTTLNRQGPDVGTQYRSAIFVHDQEQRRVAEETIARLQAEGRWAAPVVTTVEPAGSFWRAEEYHQRYLEKNGLPVCSI